MTEALKLRESDDIQGDVIAGFKKDRMTLLFLKFEDPARARMTAKSSVASSSRSLRATSRRPSSRRR